MYKFDRSVPKLSLILPIVWYLFSVGLASLDKNGCKNRKGFSPIVEDHSINI